MVEQLSPTGPAEVALRPAEAAAARLSPFVRDRLTWLLYIVYGYMGTLINGLGPSVDGLRGEIGLSHAEANLHSSLMAVGGLALGFVGERVIRMLGPGRTLWIAAIGTGIGVFVFTTGRLLPITLTGALITGVASALILILVPSILSDLHGDHRAAAFSEINSIASGMGAVAPVLIGVSIALGLSWRPGFALGAALLLVTLLVFGRGVRMPAHVAAGGSASGSLPRLFWIYWFAIAMFVSVEFCMLFGTTAFLRDRFGLDPAIASGSLTVFLCGMVIGRLLAGRFVLRRTPQRLLAVALAITSAGFAAYWLAPSAAVSLAGAFVTGLGVAALYPMTLGLAVGVAPHVASLASARCSLASGTAVLTAPLILGMLADRASLFVAYSIVPVFGVLGALALVAARRTLASAATAPAEP